jgi:hypothetical protein
MDKRCTLLGPFHKFRRYDLFFINLTLKICWNNFHNLFFVTFLGHNLVKLFCGYLPHFNKLERLSRAHPSTQIFYLRENCSAYPSGALIYKESSHCYRQIFDERSSLFQKSVNCTKKFYSIVPRKNIPHLNNLLIQNFFSIF